MANLRGGAALALMVAALAPAALPMQAHGLTLSWGGGHAEPRRFTFPWASHVDVRSGDYAAQQFVEKELTAGLPMAEAVAKARAARSRCRGDGDGGEVVCRYSIGQASDEASLGEEIWTLTLTPGPDGKLKTASIDRRRSGIPGVMSERAVFHWQLGQTE
jgi:hypothetical protein